VLRHLERRDVRKRVHKYSEKHRLAMELRLSLAMLFGLSALAVNTHVSIMLAGFGLGLVMSAIGEPRRLARQLFGITEGFFGPLFFVWLGASLQVRELGDHPKFLALGVALGVGAVAAHSVGRLTGQPVALAGIASAQLGVPVAAATLGTEQNLLTPGEPAALIMGALITIAVASFAGLRAARRYADPPT
jgi:Kef-type K+ transport system membrane component KefB